MQENEKRMAGDYEIIYALQVGDREIVIGENLMDTNGQKYMCAFCTANELFAQYDDLIISEDYTEILKQYGERITKQAEKTCAELSGPRIQGIDDAPIAAGMCDSISYMDNIEGKVIVIKPEVLKREYRSATHQLKLCTGGFGSHSNSRGSACFCTDLYSGKSSRFERMAFLGRWNRRTCRNGRKLVWKISAVLRHRKRKLIRRQDNGYGIPAYDTG